VQFLVPDVADLESFCRYIRPACRYNVLAFIYGGGHMQAYRVETTVAQDGTLTLSNLPLHAGEAVEVIILVQPSAMRGRQRYPLRGTPIRYIDPTEPVAQADWEAAQ
jgi:hypothetical protein